MNQYAVLRVSPDVHREAKIRAAREGLSLKELTERALRDYMWTNRLVDTRAEYTHYPDRRDPSPSEIDYLYSQEENDA